MISADRISAAGVALLLTVVAFSANAGIYKWTDENGQVQFSDQPHPSARRLDTPAPTPPKSRQNAQPSTTTSSVRHPGAARSEVLKLRRALRRGDYAALNRRLDRLFAAIIVDPQAETPLLAAYRGFMLKSQRLGMRLDAWVAATPDHHAPYLARAYRHYHLGWEARGHKSARNTKREQFAKMADYFEQAESDLVRVERLEPKHPILYWLRIHMANIQSDDPAGTKALLSGLARQPTSYLIHLAHLVSLEPRWGGSYQQMRTFVDKAKTLVEQNPKLTDLEGDLYTNAAYSLVLREQYAPAQKLYEKAVAISPDNGAFLRERGHNLYRMEKYAQALPDLERAHSLRPDDATVLYWRAKTLYELNDYGRALADLELASLLDPEDSSIAKWRDWLVGEFPVNSYRSVDSTEQGSSEVAVNLEPRDAAGYYHRSRSRIQKEEFDGALEDIEQAIRLSPDNIDYVILLDWILFQRRDWPRIIAAWDDFIARHPNNSRAYLERSGAHRHNGDHEASRRDAKRAADMGNEKAKQIYRSYYGSGE